MAKDPSPETRTIVIVDDHEEVRDVLRMLFELEHFEILGEAGTGLEAIPLVLQHQPTFVVLDYLMPGMNGDGVAGLIRKMSPSSRIVAFSAHLCDKPEWADAYLNKDRIGEIAPFLEALLVGAAGSRGNGATASAV